MVPQKKVIIRRVNKAVEDTINRAKKLYGFTVVDNFIKDIQELNPSIFCTTQNINIIDGSKDKNTLEHSNAILYGHKNEQDVRISILNLLYIFLDVNGVDVNYLLEVMYRPQDAIHMTYKDTVKVDTNSFFKNKSELDTDVINFKSDNNIKVSYLLMYVLYVFLNIEE